MPALDWLDIATLLVLTVAVTAAGHRLAGGISDRRGFFQASGALPWWAVSASIIATVISSVTFISVPSDVFKPGGNLGYAQILMGLMVGKLLTAAVVARAYFDCPDIDTTYDYVGRRVHPRAGRVSLVLGLSTSVITAAVKLLASAIVLAEVTGWSMPTCTFVMTLAAVLWSAMAGLKTVIWTDFVLFGVFTSGAIAVTVWGASALPYSWSDSLAILDAQAKLALFDFSIDPAATQTLWAGLIGASVLSLSQAMAQGTLQRVRACRSAADARKAYYLASLFYVTPLCMFGAGLVMVLFYNDGGVPADLAARLAAEPDRIFPYFIVNEIPAGLSSILVAAIFAAGISTLDTALTELADVTVSNGYARFWRPDATDAHYVMISRATLVFWGMVLAGITLFFSRFSAEGLLNLTFKLPNYVNGLLLGTLIIARYGLAAWPGYLAGLAVGAATVVAVSRGGVGFFWWCPASALTMVGCAWAVSRHKPETGGVDALAPSRPRSADTTRVPAQAER